jgi:beta-lactamase class A
VSAGNDRGSAGHRSADGTLSDAPAPGGFAAQMRQAMRDVDVPGRLHVAAWELGVEDGRFLIRGDEAVSAASTIKVPILAAVLKEVSSGQLQLERPIPIPARRAGGSGVLQAMTGIDTLTLADLLTLMVIVSDNAATNTIIETTGMGPINAFCAELGLRGTVLRRLMMDMEAARRGLENTTTALDQSRLLEALAGDTLLAEPLRTFAIRTLAGQQFNDALPSLLPEDAHVAHKTGDLPGVRHDVGIITAASGRRAVVSVLVTGLDGAPATTRAGDVNVPESPQSMMASAGMAIAAVGHAAWQALEGSVARGRPTLAGDGP